MLKNHGGVRTHSSKTLTTSLRRQRQVLMVVEQYMSHSTKVNEFEHFFLQKITELIWIFSISISKFLKSLLITHQNFR